jgi:eukaryotic-like serine/threonine-protein kinase
MDASTLDRGGYVFGAFHLDAARRTLTRDGVSVALTPTVFDLLRHLVANAGRVIAKDELFEAVWPGRYLDDSNLTTTVFVLRKALKDAGEPERLIVTAPGRGYVFTGEVRPEPAIGAAGVETTPRRRSPMRVILAGIAACAAVAIIAGVLVATGSGRGAPAARSALVLAEFQNLTGDPVFDHSLDKAVAIDLDQSPFLSVLPDQQVQDTLVLMKRSKDERMTPALAQEVCARNNGAGVLQGSIAAVGATYLLTLTTTDCAGTKVLASRKTEVVGRERVVAALDHLTGRVRRELGESNASIRKFGTPLLPEQTASLAALKAFSEGAQLQDHGQGADSIPFFQHAIELDPNFAVAYAALAHAYRSFMEDAPEKINISKAYALRDSVSERERFNIVSRYHQSVTGNLGELIRDVQLWSATYPRDPAPWMILADAQMRMGRFAQGVGPARRALDLGPGIEDAYSLLARAYWYTGEADRALAVCASAAAKGLAGEDIHLLLLRIALNRHDQAGVATQMAWFEGKPAARQALSIQAVFALRLGQLRRAEAFFARQQAVVRLQGVSNIWATVWVEVLAQFGLEDRARALLKRIGADPRFRDYEYVMAAVGDAALAQRLVADHLRSAPADTYLNEIGAPSLKAQLALRRGKPLEAIAALQGAAAYDTGNPGVPYLRGLAYLAASDGPHAVQAFQTFIRNEATYPNSNHIPLAELGLARAYKLEGDLPASRRQYQVFLADWKDADPDLPLLVAAKAEYAALSGASQPPRAAHAS